MRFLSLALAIGLTAPATKATARLRDDNGAPPLEPPPEKRSRRVDRRTGLLQFAPQRSPCGRHLVEVDGGAIFVDGKRVHPVTGGSVHVLGAPTWRQDGDALAWLERRSGETRLVVLPEVANPNETLVWPLPRALSRDRAHWAAKNKVVVGPEVLQPRAVASWE